MLLKTTLGVQFEHDAVTVDGVDLAKKALDAWERFIV
jgi:hypothetical protein